MTDEENRMIRDLHQFFMVPSAPGRKTRAEQIDRALTAIESGGLIGRLLLYVAAAVITVGTAWGFLKGWIAR